MNELYALWCSWGNPQQNPAEWAALVMESCPVEEEKKNKMPQNGKEESRDGVSADV